MYTYSPTIDMRTPVFDEVVEELLGEIAYIVLSGKLNTEEPRGRADQEPC
jgi:hypothetical protein